MFISPFHPQTSVHWVFVGFPDLVEMQCPQFVAELLALRTLTCTKTPGKRGVPHWRFGGLPSSHHTWLAGNLRKKCWFWWKSHLEMVGFPLPCLIAVYVFHMSEYVSRSLPAIASFHRRKLRRMDKAQCNTSSLQSHSLAFISILVGPRIYSLLLI